MVRRTVDCLLLMWGSSGFEVVFVSTLAAVAVIVRLGVLSATLTAGCLFATRRDAVVKATLTFPGCELRLTSGSA